jgi:hypothetical protein
VYLFFQLFLKHPFKNFLFLVYPCVPLHTRVCVCVVCDLDERQPTQLSWTHD